MRLFTCATLLAITLAGPVLAEPLWVDVRSNASYSADHIEGDLNMPLAQLDVAALASTYGKDVELQLYCNSGNQAGQAKALLEAAGFTNVTNAGGIATVRQLRENAQQSLVAEGHRSQ